MPSTNPIGAATGAMMRYGRAVKAAAEVVIELGKQVDQTAKKIITAADAIGGRWVRVNDIAFKTARTMAMSREEAVKYNDALFKSTRAIASQFGITYREIDNFQKSYAEAIGRNVVLTIQQKEQMAALSKITDAATAARLVDEFDKVGVGITRATAYTGRLQERAKALGVSPAKATKTMADNIKLAASYSFRNGVNDIEKMAMRATSMRMDMNAIMSATEKFANIEDAIGTSANIQMLGGSFAREFSNPMGAMYEAMADPQAFQERILRTVQGKGRYDAKTGAVTFDPVTMRMMRELAKNLGMTVDQITNPAMAEVQNKKVEEELQSAGKWNQWSPIEQEAIKNLSRTNVNEETGKHFVTYLDENGNVVERNIEDLTKEELKIAQDRQMSEENMFSDVQEIKDILKRTLDRARDTTSVKEKERGLMDLWDSGIVGGLQNLYMPFVSGIYNKVGNWLGGLFGGGKYAQGGVVKPIAHANFGTIVPGDSYMGDHTPVMANGGEMILNPMQQKSMFNLISTLALTGGASKVGSMMGVKGLGTTTLMASALGGGDPSIKNFVEAYFLKKFIKNMIPLKDSIGDVGKVAKTTTEATTTFTTRLTDVSKKWGTIFGDLGKKLSTATKTYFTTGRLGRVTSAVRAGGSTIASWGRTGGRAVAAAGRWASTPIVKLADAIKSSKLATNLKDFSTTVKESSYNRKAARFTTAKGQFKSIDKVGGKFSQNVIKVKGYGKELTRDIKSIFKPSAKAVAKTAAKEASAVSKAGLAAKGGKLLSNIGKAGKFAGKFVKPLAAVGAIAGIASDVSAASSQYDARIDEIERSGMSEQEKARAKDRATKQKNTAVGGSVGKNAGMAIGGLAGAAKGAALGSFLGPVGTIAGGLIGGAIGAFGGEKLGGLLGKGVGSMFGGSEEKKFKQEQKELFGSSVASGDNTDLLKTVKSIDSKMPSRTSIAAKSIALSPLAPIEMASAAIKALPDLGIFKKVSPSKNEEKVTQASSIGKTDINLNVNGTIKLEGGGKSVDFDLAKLIDTPEFKRQLADIVTRRINESSNSGKRNMESERNNMASQYNKSGK